MRYKVVFTKHAKERINQRGFQKLHLDLLDIFGEEVRLPGGAIQLTITKQKRSQIIQALDKAVKKAIVLSTNNANIITVFNKDN